MDQINILGQVWDICELPLEDHGDCDADKKLIQIDSACTEKPKIELHETIHAIFAVSGLSHMLEDCVEEAIAIALENGLWQAGYRRKTDTQ